MPGGRTAASSTARATSCGRRGSSPQLLHCELSQLAQHQQMPQSSPSLRGISVSRRANMRLQRLGPVACPLSRNGGTCLRSDPPTLSGDRGNPGERWPAGPDMVWRGPDG